MSKANKEFGQPIQLDVVWNRRWVTYGTPTTIHDSDYTTPITQ